MHKYMYYHSPHIEEIQMYLHGNGGYLNKD